MVFVVAGIVVEVVVEKMAVPEVVPDVRVIVCIELAEIAWMVSCCWAATVIVRDDISRNVLLLAPI